MIAPLPEMLREAGKRNAAVLAPDFFSRHMLELELDIAEAHQAPIIASYPALALDSFRRYRHWVAGLRLLCEKARVPVCLHLDHGKNVQVCLRAIDAGFASVMIDGSALPLAENVRMTKTVAFYKHNPLRLGYSSHKAIRQRAVIEPILLRYFRLTGSVAAA